MKKQLMYILMAGLTLTSCEEVTKLLIKQKEEPKAVADYSKYTQEDSTHMFFKNVPINGPLEMFVKRMEQQGFKNYGSDNSENILIDPEDSADDGTAVLYGDFADYKDCILHVQTLDSKDVVAKINVAFPVREEWDDLHGDYKHLKEMLTTKYGKPSACREKINIDPIYISGRISNHDRMYAVGDNRCEYVTTFTTDKGDVKLSIEPKTPTTGFVMLTYTDKINSGVIRKHAIDDL